MRISNSMIGLFFLLAVASCKFNSVYEDSLNIPDRAWNKKQPVKFEFPVTDTINGHKIFIHVRNSNEYRYSNFFLFVTTFSPDGKSRKDTLELQLANDNGKWLGKGFGGIWATDAELKKGAVIRFPVAGTYKVEMAQAMRDDVLHGIIDVGIRVDRAK